MESFYALLGVDEDADAETIEAAYREQVKKAHPDHSDDPDATEEFRRLTTARDVLVDEAERARYDRLGHRAYVDGFDGGPPAGNDSGADGTTREAGDSEDGDGWEWVGGDEWGWIDGEPADGTGPWTNPGTWTDPSDAREWWERRSPPGRSAARADPGRYERTPPRILRAWRTLRGSGIVPWLVLQAAVFGLAAIVLWMVVQVGGEATAPYVGLIGVFVLSVPVIAAFTSLIHLLATD